MIRIENLSYAIPGKQILSNFSLHVKKGEKHLISGPSGAGKTSLFRLLLGFAQPDQGRIQIKGLDLNHHHINRIRRHIFYLSQDVDLPHETGEILIKRTLQSNNLIPPDKRTMRDYLDILALPHSLLKKDIVLLSGGERQRMGLLLGLIVDRPIWLLDEPSSALDNRAKERLSQYTSNLDNTMIIISHDNVWSDLPNIIIRSWQ